MSEKQSWLRVVGGKEYRPTTADENLPNIEDSFEITPHQLLMVFANTISNMPADFHQSIKSSLLEQYQQVVRSYTCGQLYNYLTHSDIWIHPTFTRAALDEVLERKDRSDYSPRG